jgi:predicted transcriptional regulator
MKFQKLLELRDYRNKLPTHSYLKYANRPISAIKKIGLHHGATKTGSPLAYANYHVHTLGWPGVAYPFIIDKNGVIYWCHDITKITYQVGVHNRYVLGICFIGDFRIQDPTPLQYQSFYRLVEALKEDVGLTDQDILGHQEFAGYEWKQCPAIAMDQLRGEIAAKTYGKVRTNWNNDRKILISRQVPTQLTKEDVGGMANVLFQPSNKTLDDSVKRVLSRLSNKTQDSISKEWRKKFEKQEMTESDALALVYYALDKELIQGSIQK